jgi:hypothetical protein
VLRERHVHFRLPIRAEALKMRTKTGLPQICPHLIRI